MLIIQRAHTNQKVILYSTPVINTWFKDFRFTNTSQNKNWYTYSELKKASQHNRMEFLTLNKYFFNSPNQI